jgi:hypothetical protein
MFSILILLAIEIGVVQLGAYVQACYIYVNHYILFAAIFTEKLKLWLSMVNSVMAEDNSVSD